MTAAAESDRQQNAAFPWRRAVALALTVWVALTAAGMIGGQVAERLYETNDVPAAPYTARQARDIDRVAPAAARVARTDIRLWSDGVAVGRELARAEGTLMGASLMAALWALAALIWVVRQLRSRSALPPLGRSADLAR